MANIITYLEPNLKSTYNLWKTLNGTSDVVTCAYFDLPYRVSGQRFASEPSVDNKNAAQNIATWIQTNVRSFTYIVLTLDNYNPTWTSIPDLECIKYASEGSYDKIYLSHTEEDVDTNHTQLRACATAVRAEYSTGGTLTYPLRDAQLGSVDAVQQLPADLLALVTDSFVTARKNMLAAGSSRADIIALEKQFRLGQGDYAALDDKGEWFIEHPTFGNYQSPVPFLTTHPYYKYLTV